MAKKGLVFIQNEKPSLKDRFTVRKVYRFIPDFGKNALRTYIELELHKHNICILSFYSDKNVTGRRKYQLREGLGAGHTLAIFKACLEAFYELEGDFALVFSAANDVGADEEDNSRYSAYRMFLRRYFMNYDEYIVKGSIKLNTMMLYHQSYQFKEQADAFYNEFEKKVQLEQNDSDDENK